MKTVINLLLVTVLYLAVCDVSLCKQFRKDGDFILGAILPLSKASGDGRCSTANPLGVAVTEAYMNALERIEKDSDFANTLATHSIGYDIRDSCNDPITERIQAFHMSTETLAYVQNNSLPKPVSIVLSEFTKKSSKTLHALNTEGIPQMSYSKDNARLMNDNSKGLQEIKMLVSAYPENILKIEAVLGILDRFKFDFVNIIVSDNYQGNAGLDRLTKALKKKGVLTSNHIVESKGSDVDKIVNTFLENPLVTVTVVHTEKDIETKIYKKTQEKNITNIIFISTQDWHRQQEDLKKYASVLEGMIYVELKDERNYLETYFTGSMLSIPFTGKDWIKPLFISQGGNRDCLTGGVLGEPLKSECEKAESNTKLVLAQHSGEAYHAFTAAYIIINALQSKKKEDSLLDAMATLKFRIPLFPTDELVMTDNLTAESSSFMIYNIHGNTNSSFDAKWLGVWKKGKVPELAITVSDIRWKNDSKEVPISTCAKPCQPGFRKVSDVQRNCWVCQKCPNGTVTNVTNADECFSCRQGTTPKPDQSNCVEYELITFKWFGPMGSFIIFLIVIGVCLVLFALGVFSQNSEHEIVKTTGFRYLLIYIFACLIQFLSPVPLLVEPTVKSCSCYIAFFNIGVTLCFAVLMARSEWINRFYGEDGSVVKGTCGRFPRFVCAAIIVLVQVLIMLIGLTIDKPLTMHNDTDIWNERYFECSNWASYVFWIGFGYNIALSIIGNCLSCTSTKVLENCAELKYILITYCMFYLIALFEVVIFYRYVDAELAAGQAVMCVLFGIIFYVCFILPKLHSILFRSNDGKLTLLSQDDHETPHMMTAMHASDGFRHHGVVQMRIKEEVDG